MTATRSVLRLSALLAQLMLAVASWAEPPLARPAEMDAELLLDLVGWASRLSHLALPPGGLRVDALPQLRPLALDELTATVCPRAPASCRRMVAAYNTEQQVIVYRDTLDLRDPTDQSFIVHELVHFLQHRGHGAELNVSCEAVQASERQAYDVQNAYLARFHLRQLAGELLRLNICPGATAAAPGLDSAGSALLHPAPAPNPAGP